MPKPRLHGVNRASIPDPISSVTQEINGVKRKITTSLTSMKSKRTKQKSALLHSDCTNIPPVEIQPSCNNTTTNSLASSQLQPKEPIDPELLKSIKNSILQGWKPPVQKTGTGLGNSASYTQTSKRVHESIQNPLITNSYKRSLRSTDSLPTWQPPKIRKQSKTDMQKDNRNSGIPANKMDLQMQGWQPPMQKSKQTSLETELQTHQVNKIHLTGSSEMNEDEQEQKSVDSTLALEPEFCLKQSMDEMVVQQEVRISQVYEGPHQSHKIQSPEHSNTYVGEDNHEKEKRSAGNVLPQLSQYPLHQQEHKMTIRKEDQVISQHVNETVIDSLNFSPKNDTKNVSDSDDYFIDNSQPKSANKNTTLSVDVKTDDFSKNNDQAEDTFIMEDINSEADMFDTQDKDDPAERTTPLLTKGKLDDNFHKYTPVDSLEIPVSDSKLKEILCTPPNNEVIDFSECPTQKRANVHSFECEVTQVAKDTTGETNISHNKILGILVPQYIDKKIHSDDECSLENYNFSDTKLKFEKRDCNEEIRCTEKLSQENEEVCKVSLELSMIHKSKDKMTVKDEENNRVSRNVEQAVVGKVQDGLLLTKSLSENIHTKEVKYNEKVANDSSPVTKETDKNPSELGKIIQENIDDLTGPPLLSATSPNMKDNYCKVEKEVDISRNEEQSVNILRTYQEVPHKNSSNDKIKPNNPEEDKEIKDNQIEPKEICSTNRNITLGNTENDRAFEKVDTEHNMQQDLNDNNSTLLALPNIESTHNEFIENTNEQVATDITKNTNLPSTFASSSSKHRIHKNNSHSLPTMMTLLDEVVVKYENKYYDDRTAQKDDRVKMEPYTIEMDQEFDISPSQLMQIEDACKHEMSLGAIPGINDTGSLPVAAAIDKKLENKTFVVRANQTGSGRTSLSHGVTPHAFVIPTTQPLPPTNWIKKIREDRQKLRSTIHEISRLNAMLMQVRREVWPGTRNPVDAPVKSDANRPGPSSRRF